MVAVRKTHTRKPETKVEARIRRASREVNPREFTQKKNGLFMGRNSVFSLKNRWNGRTWKLADWDSEGILVLAEDGTLLLLDGQFAIEVTADSSTIRALAKAHDREHLL